MNNKVIIAFSTCPDLAEGRALADRLVGRGLAACVNLIPQLTSVYRWQGRVQSDDECLLVIKTTEDSVAAVRDCILQHHSYELPEMVAVPVCDGLPAYLQWVVDQCARRT